MLGAAGAGKTHLMRALRDQLHRAQQGYFGYLQLTTDSNNYGRYILCNLIDSLAEPYHAVKDRRTGLRRLSDAMADQARVMQEHFKGCTETALETLREHEMSRQGTTKMVGCLAERVKQEPRFSALDIDFVRVLLYLQTSDPVLHNKAIKYLRCERLSPHDEEDLGGIASRVDEHDPIRLLTQLGQLMWITDQQVLVLAVDQIESIANMTEAKERFQRAVSALNAIADNVPSSIVVLACLQDYYTRLRDFLPQADVDRFQTPPKPVELDNTTDAEGILKLVTKRLHALYTDAGLDTPEPPHYPFDAAFLESLAGLRFRKVLDLCREWQEACQDAGELVPLPEVDSMEPAPGPDPDDGLTTLEQHWNAHYTMWAQDTPTEGDQLAALLDAGIGYCRDEDPALGQLDHHRRAVDILVDGTGPGLHIAVCNRASQGGGLLKEIQALDRRREDGRALTVVRAAPFPVTPTAQTNKLLDEIGARKLIIEPSTWRAIAAMGPFRDDHQDHPAWATWLQKSRPLLRHDSLRALLPAAESRPTRTPEKPSPKPMPVSEPAPKPATSSTEEPSPAPPKPTPTPPATEKPSAATAPRDKAIHLGDTTGPVPGLLECDPASLTRHAAFLGGTGCGKTTLALRAVEALLFRRIPVVLIDRKGDLCNYAAPEAWPNDGDESVQRARRQLAEHLHARIYTPGHPEGNPLQLGLLPGDLNSASDFEREQIVATAANALSSMMGYGKSRTDQACQTLLKTALLVYTRKSETPPTLGQLAEFINLRDHDLMLEAGGLKSTTFDKLAQDIEVLRLGRGAFLETGDAELNLDALLRPGGDGRTPLSIISTKFMGEAQDIEFWIAQFLMRLERWISANPAGQLQAAILFDEADLYLPAQRQPATKQPMENLLKRARSAGIGLLLATQSPGDLDYRCRENVMTWFLGRIKEDTALNKMKPMLREHGDALANRLPGQQTGHFLFVREQTVTPFKAIPCLVPPTQQPEDTILRWARRCR
jgi:hypothetical protein